MRHLVFLIVAVGWLACLGSAQATSPPVFPEQYTAHGVILLPYAELREPFSAYYDGQLNRSRIDYYGDLMITVQKSRAAVKDDEDVYGAEYQIAYEADMSGTPKRVCFKNGGSENGQITGQTVLPNLDGFVRIGSTKCPVENVNDFKEGSIKSKLKVFSKPIYTKAGHPASCELWRRKDSIGEKQNTYSFWFKHDPKTGEPIPVSYEMRGYNNLLGSHYDHYIVQYTIWREGLLNEEIFNIDARYKCGDFPGPGDGRSGSRKLLMNPIKAYFDTNRQVYDEHFDEYKNKHNKTYDTEFEHEHRRKIFLDNSRFIVSMNRRNPSFKLAINHLADKSEDELKVLRGRIPPKKDNGGMPFRTQLAAENAELPAYWDWRLQGASTPVRDQAVCGSCWVFGTLGAIDSHYFIKYGHLPILSEQQVVDCAWPFEVNGCSGGNDVAVYKYAMHAGGLALEDDYGHYLGVDGKCHATEVKKTVKLSGWVNVTQYSIEDMKKALMHGPVTIAINAAVKTFSYYSNGVYDDPACIGDEAHLDHQVLLVGYGTLNGKDYWLVKNSWSTYWGNDGYILIAQKDNICGVTTQASYPVIA